MRDMLVVQLVLRSKLVVESREGNCAVLLHFGYISYFFSTIRKP